MAQKPEYITRDGMRRLEAEFNELRSVERPRVTEEVRIAAAHGDRSENAEYKYGKQRLREIDRRLRFLSKRRERLTIVDPPTDLGDVVVFGCWVETEDEDGQRAWYQLVGTDEIDAGHGKISTASPMGRLLLGKRVGDELTLRRPRGDLELEIVRVAAESDPHTRQTGDSEREPG